MTLANDTVLVSNGVYEIGGVTNWPAGTSLTNRVVIYKAITVRSANNDPTNTIIRGAGASNGNTNGVDAAPLRVMKGAGGWREPVGRLESPRPNRARKGKQP